MIGPCSSLRIALLPALALALLAPTGGCAGQQIPAHDGYKSPKSTPWKKPKVLTIDEDLEGEIDGELDYAGRKRARWLAVDLAFPASMQVQLQTGGDDRDLDIGLEILDDGFNVLAKADAEDEDAGEARKERSIKDVQPGRYYIHLYLQGRLDRADYTVHVKLTHSAVTVEAPSDFPAEVAFVEDLPVVPIVDDSPPIDCKDRRFKTHPKCAKKPRSNGGHRTPEPEPEPAGEPTTDGGELTAKNLKGGIIAYLVINTQTKITINRGADHGVKEGMKGKVVGVDNGGFTITKVAQRSSTAMVSATIDQVKKSGSVVINP